MDSLNSARLKQTNEFKKERVHKNLNNKTPDNIENIIGKLNKSQ